MKQHQINQIRETIKNKYNFNLSSNDKEMKEINGMKENKEVKENKELRETKEVKDINESDPLQYQECIIILKWLSTIKEHEKLDISSLQIYSNSIFNNIYRSFTLNESRHTSLQFIYQIINDSIKLLSSLYENYKLGTIKKQQVENLILAITGSCQGIRNLKVTYSSDRMLICFIDSIIEDTITIKFIEIYDSSPELFSENELILNRIKKKDITS